MKRFEKSESGFTLVELLVAIAIISLVTISLIPLFLMSANTTNRSVAKLNSTYLGRDAMELVYHLSTTVPFEDLEEELVDNNGFTYDEEDDVYEYEYGDGKQLLVRFSEEDESSLIRVYLEVNKDGETAEKIAQYETLYFWLGRGILE